MASALAAAILRADNTFSVLPKSRKTRAKLRIAGGLRAALQQGRPGQWSSDHREETQHFTGWSYVAITAIAKQAASAEVNIYDDMRNATAKKMARRNQRLDSCKLHTRDKLQEPVDLDHPLMRLLRRPSKTQSGASFRYEQVVQLALTGSCLIWKVRNRFGRTVERFVIPTAVATPVWPSSEYPHGAWRIQPHHSVTTPLDDGFVETHGYFAALGRIISADDVMVIRWPHPLYKDDGLSPMAAGSHWIDTAEMVDRARWSHMRNGPDPSIVVEPPDDIDPGQDELDSVAESFNKKYAGPDNTGKAIFVGHNKVTQIGHNARQMAYETAFIQLRDSIMALHGVPGAAVGLQDSMTYGALAASLRQFITLAVEPYLDLMAEEETEQQAPEFAKGLTVEFAAHHVDDPDLLETQLQTDISAGGITIDELREIRGRAPLPNSEGQVPATQVSQSFTNNAKGEGEMPEGGGPIQSLTQGMSVSGGSNGKKPPGNETGEVASSLEQEMEDAMEGFGAKCIARTTIGLNASVGAHGGFSVNGNGKPKPKKPPRFDRRRVKEHAIKATVAVDLDGTLAKYNEDIANALKQGITNVIGAPRKGARSSMQQLQDAGIKVIVFTTRGDTESVANWLRRNDIPFDHINENPDQPENAIGKVIADVYWDDRAVNAAGSLLESIGEVIRAANEGFAESMKTMILVDDPGYTQKNRNDWWDATMASRGLAIGVTKSSGCGANTEGGGGFQVGNDCARENGNASTGKQSTATVDQARVDRALRSHKPATAEKQRHAERNQGRLVAAIGGRETDDNKPMDVIIDIGGTEHGFEVKTLLDNKNDKITVHPKSRRRKLNWESKGLRKLHTLVFDDRDTFSDGQYADQFSGVKVYYKSGVGAFRLTSMTALGSINDLAEIIGGGVLTH